MSMPFGRGKSEKRPEEEVEEGSSFPDSPATEAQTGESAPQMPITFRPAFLDDDQQGKGMSARAPATELPGGDAFFVSVTQDGNSEVHRFDDPSTVQAFVEELLEKGTPEEFVTAFSGRKLALRVTQRPVVKLVSSQKD
ncbi:MAG: hypothetical protein V3S20_10775 [Dehalococcoidia bacterium]